VVRVGVGGEPIVSMADGCAAPMGAKVEVGTGSGLGEECLGLDSDFSVGASEGGGRSREDVAV
jgi:hypothetical protein